MKHANLEWDESGTPCSLQFDDYYFSTDGGLDETRYIFLEHNNLEDRFRSLAQQTTPKTFVIAETGFGTGLNLLAVCQLWDKYLSESNHTLEFISTEKFPLTHKDMTRALTTWPELKPWADALTENYPKMCTGFQKVIISDQISVILALGDASESFSKMVAGVDAWFLDGFSPSKNPEIWTSELFAQIQRLSHKETTYATFTAARVVRDLLSGNGFSVTKDKGFGVKREMVYGSFIKEQPFDSQQEKANSKPWFKSRADIKYATNKEKTAIIIGAGLAGAHTASSLAKTGWRVTVLDKADQIASGASGNYQGVIYTKPASKETKEDGFYLSAFQYAVQHFKCNFKPLTDKNATLWKQTGLLQLAQTADDEARLQSVITSSEGSDLMSWQTPEQASTISGIPLDCPALFYPDSGWVNPVEACRTLLQHENIQVICHQEAINIEQALDDWIVTTQDNTFKANIVVLAAAWESDRFEQTNHLNLTPIRGQVSRLALNEAKPTATPRVVICSDAYVTPIDSNHLNFGATFDLKDTDTQYRLEDVEKNVNKLKKISREFDSLNQIELNQYEGRAAVRCITNDRLPVVGQINNHTAMLNQYLSLIHISAPTRPY